MGVKFGLNGVDNAQLKYKNVRIPRENMMNRYADVTEDGVFKSDVKNISGRFFKVTERLLSGRICISSIALGPTKACLYIAVKYAQKRKSIGIEGESSVPIFNYQLQQNAIIPLLCRTLALNCMYNYARDVYKTPKGKEHELLSLCCITKTMLGWNLNNVAVTCRERCGGMGYLAVSRFGEYIALAHSALTAEGDNRVLMTKITKDYMTNVAHHGFKLPVTSKNVKT
jgi:acyl-CoA oxidase